MPMLKVLACWHVKKEWAGAGAGEGGGEGEGSTALMIVKRKLNFILLN